MCVCVHVCACVCMCVHVCACVCMCVWCVHVGEREGENPFVVLQYHYLVFVCISLQGWSDTYLRWSPRGSYLATFHVPKGIAVWGAVDFKRIQRFLHPGAQMVDFSPCEKCVPCTIQWNLSIEDTTGTQLTVLYTVEPLYTGHH